MTSVVVGVIAVTSVGSYWVASQCLGLRPRNLSAAVGHVLDCIGTILIFFALNLAVGAVGILGARAITGQFVSLYILEDETWFVFSALQGLTWSLWKQKSRGGHA